jgi:hypothetical protein
VFGGRRDESELVVEIEVHDANRQDKSCSRQAPTTAAHRGGLQAQTANAIEGQ